MQRALLLGANGMCGTGAYQILKDKYELVLAVRTQEKVALLERAYGGTAAHRVVEFDALRVAEEQEYLSHKIDEIGDVDHVVNCLGITKALADRDPQATRFVNGKFPHLIAAHFGPKLIQVTTDCVFNGTSGFPYDERSEKTPVDVYGRSKSEGEPASSLTLRTSLIGHELETSFGLLAWFLQQKGKTINGFANHFWNGITTKEFGNVCDRIMTDRGSFPANGTYHVFSTALSKYDMLLAFRDKYKLECEIVPEYESQCNRTLATVFPVCEQLNIPSFSEMLAEL